MTRLRLFGGGAALLVGVAIGIPAAQAEPAPPAVTAMIDAAAASGDAATLKTVADLARKTNPGSIAEIDAQVAKLTAAAEKARIAKLSHESLFQGIKGQGQIAVADTTGNSQTLNVAIGLNLSKETLHWKNAINLEADYQRSAGVTTDEKFLANYEGNYKFSPRFYALITTGWSRDTFSGYSSRYGGSLGLGYKLIDTPSLALSVEGGPAIRRTDYISVLGAPAYDQTTGGGRAAGHFAWTIAANTVFSQDVVGFVSGHDDTLIATTALTTKLMGALSATASFMVQYDSEPPPGIETTDTTTRLGLIYGF